VGAVLALVHSNLLISIAATGVAVTTTRLLGRPLDPVPLFIVFAAALFVYSFNRVADLAEDEQNVPARAAFTRRYGRVIFGLGSLCYGLAILVAVLQGLPLVEFLALPLVAAVSYSLGRLKRLLLVKNLLVGAAWAAVPLGVGVYYGVLWTVEVWVLAVVVGAMLTAAAAVFDVKDLAGDRAAGIRTVPIVFGPSATRRLAAATAVAVAAGIGLVVALGLVPGRFLVLLALPAYVLAYVPVATPDRGPLFYGFVVDGEHIVLAGLVLATQGLA
jgi:4-hydroxybenzoate polyprenyltransferase